MIRLNQYPFREEYTYLMLQALKEERLDMFRNDFLDLHPMDQMEFFLSVNQHRRARIYTCLSPAEFAHIYRELEPEIKKCIVRELEREYSR